MTEFNIESFQHGDKRMWTFVSDTLRTQLSLFAVAILSDHQLAEDMFQETMIAAWNKRERYNSLSHLTADLHVTIRNKCFNELHRRRRQNRHIQLKDTQDPNNQLSEQDDLPLYLSIEVERMRMALLKQIETELPFLPPGQQEIFRLRSMESLTPDDIAEKLGITAQSVRNQYLNARKNIRLRLEKKGYYLILAIPIVMILLKIISLFV